MNVEQRDVAGVTIFLRSTGARLRVSTALYDLLLAFENPRDPAAVAQGNARVETAIARFRAKGFLVAQADLLAPQPGRLLTDPPVRLFDCPAYKSGAAVPDVTVFGIPYDLGDFAAAGQRHGPSGLREASLQFLYGLDRQTGRPLGWFDIDRGRPIMRGVTVGDGGDIVVDHGEPQAALFERIGQVLAASAGSATVPLLLGGDATVAFPLIDALHTRGPIGVLRIRPEISAIGTDGNGFVSPATVATRILALHDVRCFVEIGNRVRPACGSPTHAALAIGDLERSGMAILNGLLDPGQRVVVVLEAGAYAPRWTADGGGPPGFGILQRLLEEIGARCPVAGVAMTGLDPHAPGWGVIATTALHLMLTVVDTATAHRAVAA